VISNIEIPLTGAGGEPVDFARTITGHGVTSLPPALVDEVANTLTVTLAIPGGGPRTVIVSAASREQVQIAVQGSSCDEQEAEAIKQAVRHMLRLDQNLTDFYAMAASDPDLAWVTRGAGRMTRGQTVFEDVVKTICTTNCAWSGTVRMTTALVQHLGQPTADAEPERWEGRAFPTPTAMADADDAFYRGIARCGYRGAYLQSLARSVASGDLDLEALGDESMHQLSDDEVAAQLLALPGVGPYAAAHILMMLGRYSRLIFDSFTRPTYARLVAREQVTDAEIGERFASFGRYAGLAFWLFITRPWVQDDGSMTPAHP
jgi:3-methyladenine DNA glycosylase/8-oxoguanine DNA glycosylase